MKLPHLGNQKQKDSLQKFYFITPNRKMVNTNLKNPIYYSFTLLLEKTDSILPKNRSKRCACAKSERRRKTKLKNKIKAEQRRWSAAKAPLTIERKWKMKLHRNEEEIVCSHSVH